jgi:hypothetical protein
MKYCCRRTLGGRQQHLLSFARRSFISNQTCLKFGRLDLPQWGLTTTSLPVTANAMHAHAVDSHPPSTSSTLRATEYVLVRGLGAYPANTEVARTIASLRGMYGIDPPGRAVAVSAPNTCGVSCVWGYSCGHATTSLWN